MSPAMLVVPCCTLTAIAMLVCGPPAETALDRSIGVAVL